MVKGISDVDFELTDNGRIVRFTVEANAKDADRNGRPVTLSDEILLRNQPNPDTAFE